MICKIFSLENPWNRCICSRWKCFISMIYRIISKGKYSRLNKSIWSSWKLTRRYVVIKQSLIPRRAKVLFFIFRNVCTDENNKNSGYFFQKNSREWIRVHFHFLNVACLNIITSSFSVGLFTWHSYLWFSERFLDEEISFLEQKCLFESKILAGKHALVVLSLHASKLTKLCPSQLYLLISSKN